MEKALLVAAGGAAGSVARWLMVTWADGRFEGRFAWGTFLVNVIGSFLIGAVMHWAGEVRVLSENTRLLLGVGLLGEFTTYSAFAHDTLRRLEAGEWAGAALYVGATVAVCLLAVALGAKAAAAIA